MQALPALHCQAPCGRLLRALPRSQLRRPALPRNAWAAARRPHGRSGPSTVCVAEAQDRLNQGFSRGLQYK